MTTVMGYKLAKHDIFTIEWIDEKYLLGMPIIIHKVYYHRIWYRPKTWFQKCYKIKYIGDNSIAGYISLEKTLDKSSEIYNNIFE